MQITTEQFFERAKIKDPRLSELIVSELTVEAQQAEIDRLRSKLDAQTENDGDG